MPEHPRWDDAGLIDRRALFIAGGAAATGAGVALAADRLGWFSLPLVSTPDPDVVVRRFLARTEAILVRVYDEALALPQPSPAVAQRLTAYRAHHQDHLDAYGGDRQDVRALEPGGQDPAAQGLDPAGAVPVPPADPAAWPAFFAALEAAAGARDATGVRIAQDGDLARTCALVAASEAGHGLEWSRG